MKQVLWIFNSQMLWGAVLGYIIFNGFGIIQDTWHHQGAGYITYETDETVKVSESQYKRHEYTMGGFLLILGLFLWVTIAQGTRDEAEKAKAENDSLRAQVDWYIAYRVALLAALDNTTRERAEAAADRSEKVLDAEAKASVITRLSLPSHSNREGLQRAAEELHAEWSADSKGLKTGPENAENDAGA